ncbi:hypothetical protein DH2020_043146 [Rehmannia glutinosa]|uniref:GPI mannosyltransferase 2 n=1 Tax=Rehmannia glutinosa TaxID=99300 RepID=A0ABR0UKG6_REHGL
MLRAHIYVILDVARRAQVSVHYHCSQFIEVAAWIAVEVSNQSFTGLGFLCLLCYAIECDDLNVVQSSSSFILMRCFTISLESLSNSDNGTHGLRKRAIKREDLVIQPLKSEAPDSLQCDPVVILPFVLHLSFIVATAFFVMHVQVATRFLSVSPLLYWFASHIMGSPSVGKRWGHFIWAYCAAYILLGSLLFSNFYPFT